MGNAAQKGEGRTGEGKAGEGKASEGKAAEARGASRVAEKSRALTLDDFVLLKTVGKGSFGKVIQVRKKDNGKIYAMKVLSKSGVITRKQYQHTLAERRILEEVNHPFLVSLRFAFQTDSKLYMVFDFFNGGELYHYISRGRFTEERSRFYAAEIILGMEHMHSLGIVYRDLKPENLLLDADGHIRIADFGLSKENVVDDSLSSICGTPEYLAPEIIKRQKYGKAVDWWSLGTLLFEMIAGLPPFYDKNRQRMYRKILDAPLTKPAVMSEEAFDCCRRMLDRNPTSRLGYNGADEIKRHPFFACLDWNKLARKELEPPFKPDVMDAEDTANVDAEFTRMPAMVTPTPADSELVGKDAFHNFTYKCESVLDGQIYSVSDDTAKELSYEHAAAGAGGAAAAAAAAAAASHRPVVGK